MFCEYRKKLRASPRVHLAVTLPEIKTILSQMHITTCPLDPFPTSILIDSDVWLDWLLKC